MNEHVYLFSFIFYRYRAECDMWIIAYHPVYLYYLLKKTTNQKRNVELPILIT